MKSDNLGNHERLIMIFGAAASWITLILLYLLDTVRAFAVWGTLWGPCTVLLTFFALGGNIPLKWRQKGYRPLLVIPIVFWISFVVVIIVMHFLPPNTE